MSEELISGRRSVIEALRAGRPIRKIYIVQGARGAAIQTIRMLAREQAVPVKVVEGIKLDALSPGALHQGVVAVGQAKSFCSIDDILSCARMKGEEPLVVLLDHIQDPQNLGAVLRVVDATGGHGVILPKDRSASLTAAVGRASAGAWEYVRVARVASLGSAISELKDYGLWVAGLDPKAEQLYWECDLKGPLAVVAGNEGRGLSKAVRRSCDLMLRLPMLGGVRSLNVASALAAVMYEIRRQRDKACRGTAGER